MSNFLKILFWIFRSLFDSEIEIFFYVVEEYHLKLAVFQHPAGIAIACVKVSSIHILRWLPHPAKDLGYNLTIHCQKSH